MIKRTHLGVGYTSSPVFFFGGGGVKSINYRLLHILHLQIQ